MSVITRRTVAALPFLVLSSACSWSEPREPQGALIVTPYRASADYHRGDTVGWKVSSLGGGKATYTVKLNGAKVVSSGEIDLTKGIGSIEVPAGEPSMLLMELVGPDGKKKLFGASVDPELIRPAAPRPKDFDKFWAGKVAALRKIPAKPTLKPVSSPRNDVKMELLTMDHVNGTHVYGHLAQPTKPGKYPAMLIVQWASPPYPLSPDWSAWPASQGWIALNIMPHDALPNEGPDYYKNLPKAMREYNVTGADSRETSYFVEMYLRGVRAVDYLSSLPNWDGKTILVTGGSMGGQQTLAIAGLHPKVTHLMAEEPAGCDTNAPLYGRQLGYPFLSPENPKWRETNPYIDCINFASRIRAKALVGIGYIDTVCPPTGLWSAFNVMKGPKYAGRLPTAPHNNESTAEQMKPYRDVYNQWFSAIPQGKPILFPKK